MPRKVFDKDAWIVEALLAHVIVVRLDGSIWRWPDSALPVRVIPSVHQRTGRHYFTLTHNKITKSVLVNRVVGLALLPNPFNLPEVNHKDGDKGNNHPDNLEWAGRSTQEKHAFRSGLKSSRGSANSQAKLNPLLVVAIRESKMSDLELALECGVSVGAIRDARSGKTWSHL